MVIKGILFDLDGTLIDSEPLHYQLWRNLLQPYAIALSEQTYKQLLLGKPSARSAEILVETYALPLQPEVLLKYRDAALRQRLLESPPPLTPYARETLEYLKQRRVLTGLVTASKREAVLSTLTTHGLSGHFDVISTGDDVQNNKPHPDGYLLALERLGLPSAACIAIEDSKTGIQAAVAAQLTCLGIRTSYSQADDFHLATQTFDHLGEACRWISSRLT